METPITRAEHEEFRRTIDAEFKRISRRLDGLENVSQRITDLYVSVNNLATNIESMVKIQQEHTEKIEEIEAKDGEKWRTSVKMVATATVSTMVGAIIGFLLKKIGL